MSMVSAVMTPINCEGIPSNESTKCTEVDDSYIVSKTYQCITGHDFTVDFESPLDLPVFWECADHEIISYEL